MKQFLIILLILSNIKSISQENKLIKTSEYVGGKKRRDLFYDKDMNLVKEYYYYMGNFSNNNNLCNVIEYDKNKEIIKYSAYNFEHRGSSNSILFLEVDFLNGIYKLPLEKLELKFKDKFVFDGIQKGNNIVVNYINGKKNGRLIQTDSAISGKQTIYNQKVDPRYLQFNIIKYYTSIGTEEVFKLFNGVVLNFDNNNLDGIQKSYYLNGNLKFSSVYKKNLLLSHESFDKNNSYLSKITTENCLIKKSFIQNGVIVNVDSDFPIVYKSETLSRTGDIEAAPFEEVIYGHGGFGELWDFINTYGKIKLDTIAINSSIFFRITEIANPKELKEIFDNQKDNNNYAINSGETITKILGIPIFHINRFNFENKEIFEKNLNPASIIGKAFTIDKFENSEKIYDNLNSVSINGEPFIIDKILVAQNDFPAKMNWQNANLACKSLGEGWRLPTMLELELLYKKNIIGNFQDTQYWNSDKLTNGFKNRNFINYYLLNVRAVKNISH